MRNWVDSYGLVDLGYQLGPNYTWLNYRVKERLDRGFCNVSWRLTFPDAFIQHLPRVKSDCCPLLLNLFSSVVSQGINKPFRSQSMWMNHDKFSDFVLDQWKSYDGNLSHKVQKLASDLQDSNTKVFGNIFRKKRRLLSRIAGIQKSLGIKHNPFLVILETDLIKEYEEVRDHEALYWQQKLRIRWLQHGDKNTKFFHLSTLVRRRRNKIEGLVDHNGNLYSELNVM